MDVCYHLLPAHMQDGARRYVEKGILGGSFFTAVVSNDLLGAFAKGDDANIAAMRSWAMWLWNEAPAGCFGSREKVDEWIALGGLSGLTIEGVDK